MWEVDHFVDRKANIVLILQQVDLLLIVHDEKGLSHTILHVVLDAVSISFESNEPASSQLEDFFLC